MFDAKTAARIKEWLRGVKNAKILTLGESKAERAKRLYIVV